MIYLNVTRDRVRTLAFDSTGRFFASSTGSSCVTIRNFDNIYSSCTFIIQEDYLFSWNYALPFFLKHSINTLWEALYVKYHIGNSVFDKMRLIHTTELILLISYFPNAWCHIILYEKAICLWTLFGAYLHLIFCSSLLHIMVNYFLINNIHVIFNVA